MKLNTLKLETLQVESMLRKALKEDTTINVEEDKITMTLQFNEEIISMMKDIKVV